MSNTLNSYTGTGIILTNGGAYQSPFTITVDGIVSVASGAGVYSNLAVPVLLNQGLVMAASGIGVEFTGNGTVTNSGTGAIIDGFTGVELQGGASATLVNAGTVTGTKGDGALFTDGGAIYNSATGTIAGTAAGVDMQKTANTLVNDGLITGTTIGAELDGSFYIGNIGTGATISGATGVYSNAYTGGLTGTVCNEGTIIGTSAGAGYYGVQIGGGGVVTNAGTAALISGYRAVVIQAASGTVLNDGTITGSSTGVQLDHGGTVTNAGPASVITAGSYAGVRIEAGGMVFNAGTITSASAGVIFNAGGTLANLGTGLIFGKYDAVALHGSGTVYNAGTIGSLLGKYGVVIYGGGTVTNTGMVADLSRYAAGIEVRGAGAVLNEGTITATQHNASGIILRSGGVVTNSGPGAAINAYSGVYVGGGSGTVSNSGRITGTGTGGTGVELIDGGTIINSGIITSTGTGVALIGGGTIINSGTIAGGSVAADLSGVALLEVEAGAVFTGSVAAHGSNVTLELGVGDGSLSGIGSQFTGFQTIAFAQGAVGTLSGNSSGLAGGETVTGFTLGDAIILDGFAATTETVASGVGIVLSDGVSSIVLHTGSTLTANNYKFTVAGGNTKIELRPSVSFTGANTTMSGSIAALAAGEAIDGFAQTDILILDGFAATSETFVSGTGIILSNGTATETIDVTGSFTSESFLAASDGTNTTISQALVTLSGAVTLTSYEHFIIAASGEVLPSSASTIAITAPVGITSASVLNFGGILGGSGATGSNSADYGRAGAGGNGGSALLLQSAITVTNNSLIDGGAGGYGGHASYHGGSGGSGGNGGTGITVTGGAGSVTNTGRIAGGNGGHGSDGSRNGITGGSGGNGGIGIAVTGGTERITNTGLITGGNGGNGAVGVFNDGNGGAGAIGVDLGNNGSLFNTGSIVGGAGGGGDGANSTGATGGAGAAVSGGTLSNTGSITGGAGGAVYGSNSSSGAGGAGVSVNGGTLINTGRITGGAGGAVYGSNDTIGTGGVGVYIDGGVLITSGAISGTAAVQFGAIAGRLVVEQGAVFQGVVLGNSAVSDVLELASGPPGTGSYSFDGIGGSISGFNTIVLDAGPGWLLSGALLGESITGFTTADTLDLTNQLVNGITNVSGGVVLSENGVSIGTIHLASNFSLAYLNLASDGKGGTDLAYVANEVSGTLTAGITLSSTSTTILSKGLVENTAGPAVAANLASRTLNNYGQIIGGSFAGASFANGGKVINAGSGTIGGGQNAIVMAGSPGTVSNAGKIAATGGDGIFAGAGGFVSNSGTGQISGAARGVVIQGGAGTLINAGSISGTTGAAVYFGAGGSIGNTGNISSADGDGILLGSGGAAGTLTNAGSISSTMGAAVYFGAGGSVGNTGNISSADGDGILLGNGGTVVNAGTINGNGVAVSFGGAGGDLLVVGTGAVFGGNVTASGTGNRLELTNTGTIATLAGVGSKYAGFQTIVLDAGADWTVAGALLGETITGFAGFDTLDLTNLIADSASSANGVLTLSEAGVVLGTMHVSGYSQPGEIMLGSDGHGGTEIQLTGVVSNTYGAGITLHYKTTTITNAASISTSGNYAVYGAGTVTNAGTIRGESAGVLLRGANNSLTNSESGMIYGHEYGVVNEGPNGTVVNAGTITSNGFGYGSVVFWDGGTLVNSGTIGVNTLGSGGSVVFEAGYSGNSDNRLVIDPGSVIGGSVIAKGTGSNVLELGASATASSLSGIGHDFIGFNTIEIDPGSAWQLSGTLTGETITGLHVGDTLDFTNLTTANSFTYVGGVLTLYENGVSVGAAALSGLGGAGDLSLSSAGSGVTIAVVPDTITGDFTNGIILDASVTTVASGSTVSGGQYAVYGAYNKSWQLSNFGTISNSQHTGIYLSHGDVTNAASGQIFGRGSGVSVLYGTVVNAGTIEGIYGAGVYSAGTVINSGTIIGVNDRAVFLNGFSAHPVRLVVDPGAVFIGNVKAAGVNTTLELASASSAGTITGIGSSFAGFGTIDIDAGAAWTLSGNAAGLASGETINGFTRLDTIDLTGIAATSESFASGVLSLYGASGLLATLDLAEGSTITSAAFSFAPDQSGGTEITMCFYPGTQLAGEYGTVAVEDVRPGTMLRLASGTLMPVRWVGQSHISTRFADRLRSLPIRIKEGALGESLPQRDLLVSPDHALFIGGVLIQAGALVNGVSIIRDVSVPEQFTYYHVELASHELLLAEGAATESFVDNVDRTNFFNWAEHAALGDAAPIEEMAYPRAKAHRQVPMHVRQMLEARAMAFTVAEAAA